MKPLLLGICLGALAVPAALADDVLWFGAVHTKPAQQQSIPRELRDFSLQAGEALQAPVAGIVSKRRKVLAGTEGKLRLDLDGEPALAFDVSEREPSAYIIHARFLLDGREVFNADIRFARNQPLFILAPDDAVPGPAAFFILVR